MDIDIIALIDKYGLSVVIIGFLAACVCGLLKIPIVKYIQSKGLTDKQTSDRIRNICIAIVAVLSVIGISVYDCVKAKGFTPFATVQFYKDILMAITFSQVAYMLYKGVGPVSLKKWAHALIDKIFHKTTEAVTADGSVSDIDWLEILQDGLKSIHLPMTDAQREEVSTYITARASGPPTAAKSEEEATPAQTDDLSTN